MQPADLAGQLHITLHYQAKPAACQVSHARIQSQRLRLDARFFAGKPISMVPQVIGMLFSLCGTAQRIAAQQACAQAQGQPFDKQTLYQQHWQIQVETLFEHILRISQNWSSALTCPAPTPQQLQQVFAYKAALMHSPVEQVDSSAVRTWVETHLLAMPCATWLAACQQGDVNVLTQAGLIGNLLASLQANSWQALGNVSLQALPNHCGQWWRERLQAAAAAQFMATPNDAGQACETSALTRQWQHPALQVWRAAYGSGVQVRLIARVVELLQCLHMPHALESSLTACDAGEGLANVVTARGILTHRVVQQAGQVVDYQIVAPTEWNFHPQGVLQRMLQSLTAATPTQLQAQAELLITALDPCVDYQLTVLRDA